MSKNGNIEQNIKKTVDILISLNDVPSSTKNLCYGIEWLLVDKFVKDKELRNLLLDRLGDKMSALYEYVQRKEAEGMEKGMEKGIEKGRKEGEAKGMENGEENGKKIIIKKFYDAGMSVKEIAEITEIGIGEVKRFVN